VILVAASVALWRMSQTAEAALLNPHPGLVGWWRFDEGAGSVATDSSGFGNAGTINGAAWVDGKYGKASSFDGTTNNYVSLPNIGIASGSFSISVWLNPQNTGIYGTIMGYDFNRRLLLGSSGVLLTQFDGNFFSIGKVVNNAWSFTVYVFDGTNEYWYINGVFDSKHATTLPIWNAPFYIGQYDRVNYPYKGLIDEVRVYNRALSAAEIQEDFQKSPDFSSKLVAKIPKSTTQFTVTLSWQGIGSINATIQSPSVNYTEDMVPVYQKTVYSTSGGTLSMLNIKRLSISVTALSSDENWYVMLKFDNAEDYQITVEVQK
jgi:hypothetical protein